MQKNSKTNLGNFRTLCAKRVDRYYNKRCNRKLITKFSDITCKSKKTIRKRIKYIKRKKFKANIKINDIKNHTEIRDTNSQY